MIFAEGRRWLEQALDAAGEAPTALKARALHGEGVLALTQGDYAAAREALVEGLERARALAEVTRLTDVLCSLAELHSANREPENCRSSSVSPSMPSA